MLAKKWHLEDVDACLKLWGKACYFELNNGLNFQNKNILYSIDELGKKIINRQSGNVHLLADKIDGLVQSLAENNQRAAEVLTFHYAKKPFEPIRNKAQLIKLPKSTYFDLLQQGRQWIAERLVEIYSN